MVHILSSLDCDAESLAAISASPGRVFTRQIPASSRVALMEVGTRKELRVGGRRTTPSRGLAVQPEIHHRAQQVFGSFWLHARDESFWGSGTSSTT